jgi:hypothetical protein
MRLQAFAFCVGTIVCRPISKVRRQIAGGCAHERQIACNDDKVGSLSCLPATYIQHGIEKAKAETHHAPIGVKQNKLTYQTNEPEEQKHEN